MGRSRAVRHNPRRRKLSGTSRLIIFDFDQTLVDTGPVEALRAQKNWRGVMARIGELTVYPGISELLNCLRENGDTLAIVTKSPDMVPKAFVRAHDWPIDIVVGYHAVSRRKPDPEGLLLAMQRARASADRTFHVGDQAEDTLAARAAGVTALGSLWGIRDRADLTASAPDALFTAVADLHAFLVPQAPSRST